MGRRARVMLAGAHSGREGRAARDVIYVIYRWVLAQAVDVARKAFYSAIPKTVNSPGTSRPTAKHFPPP
jgi:hypothetical protein